MMTQFSSERTLFRISWQIGFTLLAGIALFFLWEEHRAHILGVLPWLLLLACPLIHLFMHRGDGHGGGVSPADERGESTKRAVDHSRHRGERA